MLSPKSVVVGLFTVEGELRIGVRRNVIGCDLWVSKAFNRRHDNFQRKFISVFLPPFHLNLHLQLIFLPFISP